VTGGSGPERIQEQVLSGQNRNLQLLAAEGLLPLPPEDLIPLQVRLADLDDALVAEKASRALQAADPRIVAPVLARCVDSEVLEFFALRFDHPLVIETIIRSKDVPQTLLVGLASRIPPDLQEILILRQDAIVSEPGILAALERNPYLSPSVRRRIGEYREHLLPRERPSVPAAEVPGEGEDELSQAELDRAIAEAMLMPVEGEIDEETGLAEGQVRTLPVPIRLQLSRGASKTLRDILIRDNNAQVALSVLQNNSFSEGEIERVANLRTVAEEVLDNIGRTRQWMRRYRIALALVKNPRTPIPLAVRMVPRMGVRDLRVLKSDRNVSEAVRKMANRLYLQKMR